VITSIGGSIVDTGGYLLLEVFFHSVALCFISDGTTSLGIGPGGTAQYESEHSKNL